MQPGVAPLPHSGRRFSVSTPEARSAHGGGRQQPATRALGPLCSRATRSFPPAVLRRPRSPRPPPDRVVHVPASAPGRRRPAAITAQRPSGPARRPCAHGRRGGEARPRQGARGPAPALTVRPVPSTITSYSSFMAGQASAAARRKEKAQAPSGRPADAGSAQAGLGPAAKGKSGGAATRRWRARRAAATSDGKRGAGRGRGGGRRPGPPQPGRGRGGARGPSVTSSRPLIGHVSVARPTFGLSQFSREEGGTPLSTVPVPCRVRGGRGKGRGWSRAGPRGLGKASWRPESGPPARCSRRRAAAAAPRRSWTSSPRRPRGPEPAAQGLGGRGPGPPPGVA